MSSSDGVDMEMAHEDAPGTDVNETKGTTTSPTAKPPSKKKKGTATAVKAPKRARTSGGGKRGGRGGGAGGSSKPSSGGAKKKPSTSDGAFPGPVASDDGKIGGGESVDGDNEGGGERGDGSQSESDSGPYCLCRGPDNHRFMIACDRCEDWFHGDCIGMDKYTGENLVQKYICPNCSEGDRYVTRYKKMCALEACSRPARIYHLVEPSIFCSEEHCQAWWEKLIATLPKSKTADSVGGANRDQLTQDEFMGLLDTPERRKMADDKMTAWRIGTKPFSTFLIPH